MAIGETESQAMQLNVASLHSGEEAMTANHAYWIDLPWNSFRYVSGVTPGEVLTKGEAARQAEISRLQREIDRVRQIKLVVESEEVVNDEAGS